MSARVTCGNCGGKVDLPAGYAKAKIRCPNCGYYAEVPPADRAAAVPPADATPPTRRVARAVPVPAKPVAKAKRSIDPRDHRPKFEADEPAGPPLLAGTDDFDDDRPYAVPGSGTKACPHCRGELPLDAKLCVHCGRDLSSGGKADRRFSPIAETHEEGWPLKLRTQVFGGVLAVDFFAAALGAVTGPGFSFGLVLFNVVLQAFVLGTFDSLTVKRTVKGKATLTRVRRIGFYPIPPQKLEWRESHAVGVVGSHNPGIFAWLVCAYMIELGVVVGLAMNPWFMPFGVLPAGVFYWVYIRPERYDVVTCDIHGGSHEVLYRTINQDKAKFFARQVADATGLWHKTAM